MSTPTVQRFYGKVAASTELQTRLQAVASIADLMALAQEVGCELTGADVRAIAQQAFQDWVVQLDGTMRSFFEHLQAEEVANPQHTQYQSPEEVIALGASLGFDFTVADLQQAADIAAAQAGFSFEKLWFKQLGLL